MERPNINVTPLIDVLLVLLIIFMIVTPTRPSSLETRIPSSPSNEPNVRPNPDTLVVAVSKTGLIRLNSIEGFGTANDPRLMIEKLKQTFEHRDSSGTWPERDAARKVFIKAPRGLSYGEVARVVDAVRLSGATPVALQIDDLE
jgi:biopolymer transport protein ExbD